MKKYIKILLTIIFILTPFIVFAEEEQTSVVTHSRGEYENLGVNKKWTITEKNRNNVLRTPYVDAEEKIYDFSNILTEEEKKQLKDMCDKFTTDHKMEIIILTYNLPYAMDKENEDFAADFYDYNDFGLDYSHYDGILLFRNTFEQDRYYDMYTFGEAQLYFNQTRYDDILDTIYGDLSSDRYLSGFSTFISKTNYYIGIGKPSGMSNKYIDEMGFIKVNYVPPYFIVSIISVIVTIIVISILVGKNKMVRKATEATEYMNKASLNYTKKQDNFITSHTTSYTTSSSSGGGGGGFSSGGSSGGGHSSGGGRHG